MATFEQITSRLADILEQNMAALCAGARWPTLPVFRHRPRDVFDQAAVFVWRESTTTEWPLPLNAHGGLQEMDGIGRWRIGVYVRLIGDSPEVATQLDVLTYNLLGLLAGYVQDRAQLTWVALTGGETRAVILDPDAMTAIGEELPLDIRWNREF